MQGTGTTGLVAEIEAIQVAAEIGRVRAVEGNLLRIGGLTRSARVGDQVRLFSHDGKGIKGEIVQLHDDALSVLPEEPPNGVRLGDRAGLIKVSGIAPSEAWIGRVVDPDGQPLDGDPILRGSEIRSRRASPPPPARRRALGDRLETGLNVFNTMLPLVRGQRLGLFAGSGVGKSTLLGQLARGVTAEVVVLAMIGERGRELRDFVENILGPEGMARSVVVAATSDQSPILRRRCAWTAMAVAEYFRDQGKQVLLLADSITRFAEAHREVAVASGEMPALRGYPPSTSHMIMSLCERAGPGCDGQGDITALFSVLVAGSDMEEPIADILRGVLDGHVVLDRRIAERGRFPAVNLLRSVSRSLPHAADDHENKMIGAARRLLSEYDEAEMMVKTGLYKEGTDEKIDAAIRARPELEGLWGDTENRPISESFTRLELALRRSGALK
ncbi:FliI/YscN family ATPase [Shimia sediminis]|uniref:FliI/YscN family ATPase n=1 Tax=Shimia sediminis TaxID=2497945 RepID=UPI000F8DCEFA|nr:FliI/YscN family ATPase [Shimia sediminis]